jgi:ubiquitin conjugation factor E4 B
LRRKRLARLEASTQSQIQQNSDQKEDNENSLQTNELKTNDNIDGSNIGSETVECSDSNVEKSVVNNVENCSNDESVKSKWPSNEIENIENKTELLPQNEISDYNKRTTAASQVEQECTSMEVECDPNSVDKTDIDSGIENMEVDEMERRESLKRQRESSSSSEATVVNSSPIVMVTPAIEDSLFLIISRIFCVEWRNNAIERNTTNSQPFKLEFDASFDETNYHNLIQMLLMDTISQIINSCDYENAFKIYNDLKPIKKFNENGIQITSTSNNDFSFPKVIFQSKEKSVLALCYILESYVRVSNEEKISPARSSEAPLKDLFADIRSQCIEFSILVITNSLTTSAQNVNSSSILTQFLCHQCLPCGFISGLISTSYQSSIDSGLNTFKAIFRPLMQSLWQEMQSHCSLANELSYKLPLQAFNELCLITIGKVNKPICQLVSLQYLSFTEF